MAYLLVCTVALLVAVLTFFSGFGLGTLLMPAFAVFFPLPVAIAATAVVHLANNLFKLILVGRDAHWPTVLVYGIPASLAAMAGAEALVLTDRIPPIAVYHLGASEHAITVVKLVIAIVIVAFAILELWPGLEQVSFPRRYLVLGGLISGFFGGLSGHQGALRSAFLIRAGLTRDQLIGTRVAGAVIVDVSRLIIYGLASATTGFATIRAHAALIAAATLAAFAGSFLGSRLVRKVSLTVIRRVVGAALLLLAAALAVGLV